MAQFGLQPNGMVRLPNGSLWNPKDDLPPEDASAFNALPMGNPLQPQTMQRAVVAPTAPSAPAAGMFGARPPVSGLSAAPDSMSSGFMPIPTPDVPAPSFFGAGGTGRNIAGIIGDALLSASGRGPIYAPLRAQAAQSQRDARRQGYEFQRQLALAQFKNANPEPSATEKTYQFLMQRDPSGALARQYVQGVANPLTAIQTEDPTTGAKGLTFVPRGGPIGAAPAAKPAPQIGAVEQGYRFMGGDPSSPSSWQKVQ